MIYLELWEIFVNLSSLHEVFIYLMIFFFYFLSMQFYNQNIVAAFRGMHVLPAKQSYAWLSTKKVWLPDRRTQEEVIPMCHYASQVTQKEAINISKIIRPKKKICVFTVRRPSLFFGPTLNFFMALLVENYLNTLFLHSNVVFVV